MNASSFPPATPAFVPLRQPIPAPLLYVPQSIQPQSADLFSASQPERQASVDEKRAILRQASSESLPSATSSNNSDLSLPLPPRITASAPALPSSPPAGIPPRPLSIYLNAPNGRAAFPRPYGTLPLPSPIRQDARLRAQSMSSIDSPPQPTASLTAAIQRNNAFKRPLPSPAEQKGEIVKQITTRFLEKFPALEARIESADIEEIGEKILNSPDEIRIKIKEFEEEIPFHKRTVPKAEKMIMKHIPEKARPLIQEGIDWKNGKPSRSSLSSRTNSFNSSTDDLANRESVSGTRTARKMTPSPRRSVSPSAYASEEDDLLEESVRSPSKGRNPEKADKKTGLFHRIHWKKEKDIVAGAPDREESTTTQRVRSPRGRKLEDEAYSNESSDDDVSEPVGHSHRSTLSDDDYDTLDDL